MNFMRRNKNKSTLRLTLDLKNATSLKRVDKKKDMKKSNTNIPINFCVN